MEQIAYKTIAQAAQESVDYIKARREHTIVPLKTRWKKFNKVCCGGLEPNMILTIAGISGTGKSAIANMIETDLIDLNPSQKVVILDFSFEMVSFRSVTRKLSYRLRRTTSELYGGQEDIDEDTFKRVQEEAAKLAKYPIFYVDTPCTVLQIENTIDYFRNKFPEEWWLIVILDHALLVEGDTERGTIVDLQKMFIRKKKLPKTSIIQLSQMNRNIEQPERINNPAMHFPLRSDLAASDALFHASDYVIAINRPELLNLQSYGIRHLPVKNKVYLHFLKIRDAGEPCILEFENDLKYGNLIESDTVNTTQQDKVVFNKKVG